MDQDGPLREHLRKLLAWEDAHVDFEGAVEGIAPDRRGDVPAGIPFSPWHLLEHLRITQHDILDFCRNPQYRERAWPKEYWPESPAPPSDLFATIPHGNGQTYLREILLVADHNAYHVGQLILVRRALGLWPAK